MNKRSFILAAAITAVSHCGYTANPASTDWVNMRIEQLRADVNTSIAQLRSDLSTVINQLAARIDGLQPIAYTLCQQAQGGVIVSLNTEGNHGLVAATRDLAAGDGTTLFGRFDIDANDPNYYLDNSDDHNSYFNWRYPNLYELGVAMQASQTCTNLLFNTSGGASFYWASNILLYPPYVYSRNFVTGEVEQSSAGFSEPSYVKLVRSF